MIPHRHGCICVKVPKGASTSVLEWFMTHGGGRPSFRPAWHGGAMSRRLPHGPETVSAPVLPQRSRSAEASWTPGAKQPPN